MAEFKKLSDVTLVEEPLETANVLIEEDGVIKRAPKSAVGGAGGGAAEEYDMVITIPYTPYDCCNGYADIDSVIVEGTVETILAAIREDSRMPKIKILHKSYDAIVEAIAGEVQAYYDNLYIRYITPMYHMGIYMYNGSIDGFFKIYMNDNA